MDRRLIHYHLGAALDHHRHNRVAAGRSSDGDDSRMNISSTPSSAGSPVDQQNASNQSIFLLQYQQRQRQHQQQQQMLQNQRMTSGQSSTNGARYGSESCLIVSSSTPGSDDRSSC